MRYFYFFIFTVLIFSVVAKEYKYDFVKDGETIYSSIEVNLNGDDYKDYIISVTTDRELNNSKSNPNWALSIRDVYFVISLENNNYDFYKVDMSRPEFLMVQIYRSLSIEVQNSQLGKLYDFFYIKDINNNGIDEVYLIEYGWDEEFFVGYEYDGDNFEKVIDIDINGYCKENFIIDEEGDLNIIRGEEYKELYQTVRDDVYKSWRTYFDFNYISGVFEEIKTVEIESPRSDFF